MGEKLDTTACERCHGSGCIPYGDDDAVCPDCLLQDKIEGLEADLDNAVEVAWKRGATEWVRLNYPKHYARFTAGRAALSREEGR